MRIATVTVLAALAGSSFAGLIGTVTTKTTSTTTTTTSKSTTTTTTSKSTTTTTTSPTTTTTSSKTTPTTTTTTTTSPTTSKTTTTTTTSSTTTSSTTPSTSATTSNPLVTSSGVCPGATATVTVYVTGSASSSSSSVSGSSAGLSSSSASLNVSTSSASSGSTQTSSIAKSTSTVLPTTTAASASTATSSSASSSVSPFSNSSTTLKTSSTTKVASSTTSSTSASASASGNAVTGTILIIAADDSTASQAYLGLNGYGIPYEVLVVPSGGTTLPALNSSSGGNYGGIVIINELSYSYSTGYASALTTAQWDALYAYQLAYGVRMVQWGVYPTTSEYGATPAGGCCNDGVEQYVMFSDTSAFPQAGLRTWANMSTQSIYHYPTTITDPSTTTEIAQFKSSSDGTFTGSNYTAAVINNFSGREQMVFFMDWNLSWSTTCTIMQHAWITWMTRGLYTGYRRVQFNTQIDDMFLLTNIYTASSTSYRVTVDDMQTITDWIPTVEAKMNSGSDYRVEVGFNGNGNIQTATNYTTANMALCNGGAIYTTSVATTALEFVKPLGSGINHWPSSPATFGYTTSCAQKDSLETWWATTSNRNNYYTISHTFTHLNLDNSTYNDTYKEITWNQDWFAMAGMNDAGFSADALIPPAITGMHNGDALRAWSDAGLTNAVGDNSRSVLRNANNNMYTYKTTSASDGFDGMTIIGRWPTRIYYDCDTNACTVTEWQAVEGVSGSFSDLIEDEVDDTMQHLFGLVHDPYMFHQLNLRNTGISTPNTTPDGTKVYSLFQTWVENMVYNFVRLCNWPMITYRQSDMAVKYAEREARDACDYTYQWTYSGKSITGVTVSCAGNTCSEPIPLTVPGSVTDTQGFTTEQIGNDPLTIWVQLTGQPVSFTLSSPVSIL